jgi:class 3 adenylate cyclase
MDPRVEQVIEEVGKTRWAAVLTDPEWNLVWVSDEMKILLGESDESKLGYGRNMLDVWSTDVWSRSVSRESQVEAFGSGLPEMLYNLPGGIDQVLDSLSPEFEEFEDLIKEMKPTSPGAVRMSSFEFLQAHLDPVQVRALLVRLHDAEGEFLGTLQLYGSALPARLLALVARGDEGMFGRMAKLVEPGRRQAAVMFTDLQDSGILSRRLPSAAYFQLVARITSAIDRVVIEHVGIVGKHVGDGATAFFLADDLGSPSGAARAAVHAARGVSEAAGRAAKEVAEETGLIQSTDLKVNVGVHWGGTLYMGQLVTGGRLEVTALGDAVNECARIQQSAREGEVLASKNLIEHLADEDAAALGLYPDSMVYRTVAELPGADDKAKRDAGTIPVTVL